MSTNGLLLAVIGAIQGFLTIPLIIRLPLALVDRLIDGASTQGQRLLRPLVVIGWIVLGVATMAATVMAWVVFGSQANPDMWPELGQSWGKAYFLGFIGYFVLVAIAGRR